MKSRYRFPDRGPSLLPIIEKHATAGDRHRGYEAVHASILARQDFCPREYCLYNLVGIENGYQIPDELISVSMRLTDDLAKDMRHRFNMEYLGKRCLGAWACRYCDLRTSITHRPVCAKGWASEICGLRYQNVQVENPGYGYFGKLHAIADFHSCARLVEHVVVSDDIWTRLDAPLREHRVCVLLYLEACRHSPIFQLIPSFDFDTAHILYQTRGYGGRGTHGRMTPFKEFKVKRSLGAATPYMEKAGWVRKFRAGEAKLPSRHPKCTSPVSTRALSCPFRKECFSNEYEEARHTAPQRSLIPVCGR